MKLKKILLLTSSIVAASSGWAASPIKLASCTLQNGMNILAPNGCSRETGEGKSKLKSSTDFVDELLAPFYTKTSSIPSAHSCFKIAANLQDYVEYRNTEQQIKFSLIKSSKELGDSLGVDINGDYSGGKFSVSAKGKFANSTVNTTNTTNIVFMAQSYSLAQIKEGVITRDPTKDLTASALTDWNASMRDSKPLPADINPFIKACGDKYISQVHAGATVLLDIKISFNSVEAKEKLEAEVKGQAGAVTVAGALDMIKNSKTSGSQIEISLLQLGGKPFELAKVLGQKGEDGYFPFQNCGTKDGACEKLVADVTNYVQNDLKSQVFDSNSQLILQNLYLYSPTKEEYNFVSQYNPELEEKVNQAMMSLAETYNKLIDNLLSNSIMMSRLKGVGDGSLLTMLENAQHKFVNQYGYLMNSGSGFISCFKSVPSEKCIKVDENIKSKFAGSDYALTSEESDEFNYAKDTNYKTMLIVPQTFGSLGTNYSAQCSLLPLSAKAFGHEFYVSCQDGKHTKYNTTASLNWLNPNEKDRTNDMTLAYTIPYAQNQFMEIIYNSDKGDIQPFNVAGSNTAKANANALGVALVAIDGAKKTKLQDTASLRAKDLRMTKYSIKAQKGWSFEK